MTPPLYFTTTLRMVTVLPARLRRPDIARGGLDAEVDVLAGVEVLDHRPGHLVHGGRRGGRLISGGLGRLVGFRGTTRDGDREQEKRRGATYAMKLLHRSMKDEATAGI